MRRSLVAAALTLGVVLAAIGTSRAAQQRQPLTPREAVRRPGGEEVTVVFRVAEGYGISGTVPVGVLPSFGLVPEASEGDPRFSVLVSGELVKIMDRFGVKYYNPGEFFKGKTVQVTGTLTVFPAPADRPDAKPSYQLAVRRWEDFRLLPMVEGSGVGSRGSGKGFSILGFSIWEGKGAIEVGRRLNAAQKP